MDTLSVKSLTPGQAHSEDHINKCWSYRLFLLLLLFLFVHPPQREMWVLPSEHCLEVVLLQPFSKTIEAHGE